MAPLYYFAIQPDSEITGTLRILTQAEIFTLSEDIHNTSYLGMTNSALSPNGLPGDTMPVTGFFEGRLFLFALSKVTFTWRDGKLYLR